MNFSLGKADSFFSVFFPVTKYAKIYKSTCCFANITCAVIVVIVSRFRSFVFSLPFAKLI